MSVGNDLIDGDHRYLICLINTVELALREPEQKQPIMDAMAQLLEYTREHFSKEERIQLKIQYPKYAGHKMRHQSLTESLQQLIAKIDAVDDAETLEKRAPDLIQFLRDWLLQHVLQEDLMMASYLRVHPRNLSA